MVDPVVPANQEPDRQGVQRVGVGVDQRAEVAVVVAEVEVDVVAAAVDVDLKWR